MLTSSVAMTSRLHLNSVNYALPTPHVLQIRNSSSEYSGLRCECCRHFGSSSSDQKKEEEDLAPIVSHREDVLYSQEGVPACSVWLREIT